MVAEGCGSRAGSLGLGLAVGRGRLQSGLDGGEFRSWMWAICFDFLVCWKGRVE